MATDNQSKNYKQLVKSIDLFNKTVNVQHLSWQKEFSEAEDRLSFIQNFEGETQDSNLLLHPGEKLLIQVPSGLIEERAGQTRYVGGSSGISVPIGSIGGHSIRYSVGSSRGHIERGAPVETEIDRGLFSITSQRLIFVGSKQTRESEFKKIVGINHPYTNRVVISSSNRQKATVLSYDAKFTKVLRLMILIAQADFQGNRDELLKSAVNDIKELKSEQPKILSTPSETEFNDPDFVPPIPLVAATSKLKIILLWVGTVAAWMTSSIPPLSTIFVIGSAYFGLGIIKSKPAKRKALIIAAILNILALLAAISYMSKGQFLIDTNTP